MGSAYLWRRKFRVQKRSWYLQARLAEEVPDNWFYNQLALQLAKQADRLLRSSSATQEHLSVRIRLDQLFLA